jgi:hypothetical protein
MFCLIVNGSTAPPSSHANSVTSSSTQRRPERHSHLFLFFRLAAFQLALIQNNTKNSIVQERTAHWLAQRLRSFGLDATVQRYAVPPRFAEYERRARTILGADPRESLARPWLADVLGDAADRVAFNVRCVWRAPKGDGTESLALSAEYGTDRLPLEVASIERNAVSSAALGVTMMRFLAEQQWLAKDVVLLLFDSEHSLAAASGAVQSLFATDSALASNNEADASGAQLQGALHLDFSGTINGFDRFELLLPAAGGAMPNLDLHNVVSRIASRSGDMTDVTLGPVRNIVGALLSSSQIAELQRATGEPSPQLNQLLSFMSDQALSLPTGRHSEFVQHNIAAVTLRAALNPTTLSNRHGRVGKYSMIEYAHVIEATLRSLNNILEPLHQSFWFYLLLSPLNYVAIGDYMISLAPIAALPVLLLMRDTLAMAAANVHSPANRRRQAKALELAFVLFVPTVLAAAATFAAVYFGLRATTTVLAALTALFGGYALVLPAARAALKNQSASPTTDIGDDVDDFVDGGALDGRAFKVFISVPALAFVGCFSLVNFSFAVCCALLITPLYLLAPWCSYEPTSRGNAAVATEEDKRAKQVLRAAYATRNVARRLPAMAAVLLLSPLTTVALASESVFQIDPLSLLSMALLQWQLFNSLWFAFVVFIYTPFVVALLCLVWLQPSHAVDLTGTRHRVASQ